MSLKIHFLHCHPDKFAEQSPAESDEHGERFHQVTARLEHWYSGKKLLWEIFAGIYNKKNLKMLNEFFSCKITKKYLNRSVSFIKTL